MVRLQQNTWYMLETVDGHHLPCYTLKMLWNCSKPEKNFECRTCKAGAIYCFADTRDSRAEVAIFETFENDCNKCKHANP